MNYSCREKIWEQGWTNLFNALHSGIMSSKPTREKKIVSNYWKVLKNEGGKLHSLNWKGNSVLFEISGGSRNRQGYRESGLCSQCILRCVRARHLTIQSLHRNHQNSERNHYTPHWRIHYVWNQKEKTLVQRIIITSCFAKWHQKK